MKTLLWQVSRSTIRAPVQTQNSQQQNNPMNLAQIHSPSFKFLKTFLRNLHLQLLDWSSVPPAQTTLSLDQESAFSEASITAWSCCNLCSALWWVWERDCTPGVLCWVTHNAQCPLPSCHVCRLMSPWVVQTKNFIGLCWRQDYGNDLGFANGKS